MNGTIRPLYLMPREAARPLRWGLAPGLAQLIWLQPTHYASNGFNPSLPAAPILLAS